MAGKRSFWQRVCCCCLDEEEQPGAPPSAEHSLSSNDSVRIDVVSPHGSPPEALELLSSGASGRVSASAGSPVPAAASPSADFPIGGRGLQPRAVALPPAQLKRALELASWSSHDLGWRVLADPNPAGSSRHFYFNVWTARTIWKPPPEVLAKRTHQNQQTDLAIPGSLAWVRGLVAWLAERDIQLHLWDNSAGQRRELCAGHRIVGRPPGLLHLLFYAHVLVNEFSIYPRSYLRSLGLRHIVLVEGLAYGEQARAAVPLVETSTLMLDPKLEEIVYVTNVLHHELFHMVDCNMIWRAGDNDARQKQHGERTTRRVGAFDVDMDQPNMDLDQPPPLTDSVEFDFDTPQSPSAAAEPLALYLMDCIMSLHSVPDQRWAKLNPPGFVYGSGGANSREKHMFLSLGRRPLDAETNAADHPTATSTSSAALDGGFLNAYCRTAVEEDKAEVYAAMIRNAGALLLGDDPILRAKAREMQHRLQWFCPDLNDAWWSRLQSHTPHPLRPSNSAAAGEWVERTDHDGHRYFFNRTTLQTSWVRPHTAQTPNGGR